MKTIIKIPPITVLTCLSVFLISCEKLVEVDVPDHKIVSETVFSDDQTAMAAMTGIYNQMFTASFSSGGGRSITLLSGLSSDNFKVTTSSPEYLEFHQNEILIANTYNQALWSSMYNIIYMANSVLEGVSNSDSLSENVHDRLLGEAKFIRGFSYFYLVNLYGSIPLLLNTDYRINSVAGRDDPDQIYAQVVLDLSDAIDLLGNEYRNGERTQVNKFVAKALLSRVYLYMGNWEQANVLSSELIAQTDTYGILEDLDQVFLANSREAIWQISPIGRGNSLIHTEEGNTFIKTTSKNTTTSLADGFMESWDSGDKRFINWIGSYNSSNEIYYYPFKYKIQYDNSGTNIREYSMVLRLAEQYLIRAEANLKSGNLTAAITDLDVLRYRAGLPLLAVTNPDLSPEGVMDIIMQERRRELFAEWGHRWLDLKRNSIATTVLENIKDNWKPSAVLYPIPEDERLKNPNLGQNPGY